MDEILQVVEDVSGSSESISLLALSKFFDTADQALRWGDIGIAQGALRSVYNGLGQLTFQSKHLSPPRIELLKRFGNSVSRIRDDVLKAEDRVLAEVIDSYDIYGRIESAAESLIRYDRYWNERNLL